MVTERELWRGELSVSEVCNMCSGGRGRGEEGGGGRGEEGGRGRGEEGGGGQCVLMGSV